MQKFTLLCLAAVGAASAMKAEFLRNLQAAPTTNTTTNATLNVVNNKGYLLTASQYNATSTVCTMGTREGCAQPGYCCGYYYRISASQHNPSAAPPSNLTMTATSPGQCVPAEFNASSW